VGQVAEIGPATTDEGRSGVAARVAAARRRCPPAVLNRSLIGEGAISALIVVILCIAVVWNLPDSPIQRTLAPALAPIAIGAGLEQKWSMYAPDPPRLQENVEVHVITANGADRVWTPPRYDRVFGVATAHRWHKLKESLLSEPGIRPDFAHWVVRELTRPSERAVRVYLVAHTEELSPPGVNGPQASGQQLLYDETLAVHP
jgi:hypothetical protein